MVKVWPPMTPQQAGLPVQPQARLEVGVSKDTPEPGIIHRSAIRLMYIEDKSFCGWENCDKLSVKVFSMTFATELLRFYKPALSPLTHTKCQAQLQYFY